MDSTHSREQPLFDLNEPAVEDESDFPLCFKPKAQSLFTTINNLITVKTTMIPSKPVISHSFSHASSGSAFQPFIQSKGDGEKETELTDRSDCNVTVPIKPCRIVGYKNVKNMAGGYSAWVDNGFAQDSSAPPEELKTACKFRR